MKPLPYDIARCSGRMDLLPDGQWCDQRDTCKRYLSLVYWDRGVVPSYRGIAVGMGVQDCQHKIEVEPDQC